MKALNHIYSAIPNKQLEFVGDEETAYNIIKKLDSMYLTFRLPRFEPSNRPLKVAKLVSRIMYQLYTKFKSEGASIYRLSGTRKRDCTVNDGAVIRRAKLAVIDDARALFFSMHAHRR